MQIYWHVILLPAIEQVYPALTSQFVLLMLASSVCSQISAEELTAVANYVQSDTYRAFETYIVVARALHRRCRCVMRAGFWGAGPRRCSRAGAGSARRCEMTHGRTSQRQPPAVPAARARCWTIGLSLIAFVGGGIVGFVVALARISPRKSVRWLSGVYVQLIQGTPLLVILFLALFRPAGDRPQDLAARRRRRCR